MTINGHSKLDTSVFSIPRWSPQRYLGFPCPNCIVQGAGFWPSLEESIPKVCTHILYPLLTFPEQRELWVQRAWKTLYKIGQTYAWLPHTGWWAIFFQKKKLKWDFGWYHKIYCQDQHELVFLFLFFSM